VRHGRSKALMFPSDRSINVIIANFMSDSLVHLFTTLRFLVHRSADPFNPILLAHDDLLTAIDTTIASLP